MEERIEEIIKEILEFEDNQVLNDEMSEENVEDWDSLVSMQIVLTLEKEYGVKFDYDEIINMDTVGDIKRIAKEKRK